MAKLTKKFNEKIEQLYDCLYEVKSIAYDKEDDFELEELLDGFIEQIEYSISDGDINLEQIISHIKQIE
jgi:hypothetical protein|tara:strand:- start:940 stop:1146 length:207 start_codon:yes stop_codon:yes gene_type:complete